MLAVNCSTAVTWPVVLRSRSARTKSRLLDPFRSIRILTRCCIQAFGYFHVVESPRPVWMTAG